MSLRGAKLDTFAGLNLQKSWKKRNVSRLSQNLVHFILPDQTDRTYQFMVMSQKPANGVEPRLMNTKQVVKDSLQTLYDSPSKNKYKKKINGER